jgi:hypothetical protein
MKSLFEKYIDRCPKSGRITGWKISRNLPMYIIPIVGFFAIIWILFRVVTKPSRLTYPCVRVAMPFASSFLALGTTILFTVLTWVQLRRQQIKIFTFSALAFGLAGYGSSSLFENDKAADAVFTNSVDQPVNAPIGTAVGILPGRVVWVHNPNATNENCVVNAAGHAWFMTENMNQAVVDSMLSSAVRNLTGQSSDSAAWRNIFQFHNMTRGKGAVNYAAGEKIFIKINATSSWGGNFSTTDLSVTNNGYYGVSETSVASVRAVLRHLVNVVGVAQTNIYIGDPLKHIYKHLYDVWHGEFPNVHYLDYSYSTLGREKVVASATAKICYSDRGTALRTAAGAVVNNDYLYSIFETAEYMINIPMLKGHQRAGVTMFAKNHLGSQTRSDASHLHNGLVRPGGIDSSARRSGYNLYRVQVDLMSHRLLGKKNLVYIMDALWATAYELDIPRKWKMAPFNNDYMSSLFVSLDPVAIESVGYDFLRSEFTSASGVDSSVQMSGVDDYLHQAADSNNWASGIKYDPDSNGVHIASLGTHEHWNNSIDKKYTRNLGTGNGIELIQISPSVGIEKTSDNVPEDFISVQNYPNPFNPATNISFHLPMKGHVSLKIYDLTGREVALLVDAVLEAGVHRLHWEASGFSSGMYLMRLTLEDKGHTRYIKSAKLLLAK